MRRPPVRSKVTLLRRNKASQSLLAAVFLLSAGPVFAKEHAPIPERALDGGILSAETFGRGNTIASNRATPASGSENPASLGDAVVQAAYATALVDTRSDLTDDEANQTDPLTGKVLQYLSVQGEKGVIFYEPLSRIHQRQILDENTPSTDYRDVDYSANAIGFAGGERLGKGNIGLSLAYLWSSISTFERRTGLQDQHTSDTADGLRMNLGVRYPTGPAMWGLLVQNAPAYLWGKKYKRELLPVRVRVGNTYRVVPGFLLSIDWERRFYSEGSHPETVLYLGSEMLVGSYMALRAGVFGTEIGKPDKRHTTAGISYIAKSGAQISYALDAYEQDHVAVHRSIVSVSLPFENGDNGDVR